jgi:hypothetical protein
VALVTEGPFSAGSHAVEFSANGLPEGVYFYKLFTGNTVLTKKMMLLR